MTGYLSFIAGATIAVWLAGSIVGAYLTRKSHPIEPRKMFIAFWPVYLAALLVRGWFKARRRS